MSIDNLQGEVYSARMEKKEQVSAGVVSFKTLAVDDLYGKQDLNCAESMLFAGNEVYGLGLEQGKASPAAAFGGGMGIGHVCGALTGGLMVLSQLFVREKAHESDTMKLVASTYLERFRGRYGSLMCDELKKDFHDASRGCAAVVALAADLLEEVVAEFHEYRVR